MNRRLLGRMAAVFGVALWLGLPLSAQAADEAPDDLMRRLSDEVLETLRSDKTLRSGNISYVISMVDKIVMPNVNFRRMTAAAVGPAWRQASAAQQQRLQDEFKNLLVRTYAGALSQVKDQTVTVKPLRAAAQDKDVLVRTEVRGRGDPVQLDYRLEKTPGVGAGWKIYNLNVMGVWLVETYRSQFSEQINKSANVQKGIDELIAALAARNQSNASQD
ncbi:MlaC/ttg2D family ABC transporter substrate-binding protein [Simplicispira psychrophila]|uniref:MlaC/ttg2D family ABC transporter substrate-binding protein n=1 Tax=Simplicispira psychrophila TaxID=80882 RepID=UPI00047F9E1A|nr:ABC transporter substrate-binding protein [Simplicispira psychrophila]